MHICDIASQFFNLVPLNSRHEHQYVEIVDTSTRFDPLKPIMMQFHWKFCIFALTQTIWIISLTRSLGPRPCPRNLLTSWMMQYLDLMFFQMTFNKKFKLMPLIIINDKCAKLCALTLLLWRRVLELGVLPITDRATLSAGCRAAALYSNIQFMFLTFSLSYVTPPAPHPINEGSMLLLNKSAGWLLWSNKQQ